MSRQEDVGFAENFLKRDGRLNRWRYFKRFFALIVMVIAAVGVIVGIISAFENSAIVILGALVLIVVLLATIYPFFCLMVRRLHDMNKSENFAYAYFAVYIVVSMLSGILEDEYEDLAAGMGLIIFVVNLYITLSPGTKGDNQYGSDPLE
ncbi:MAG: DUF805 domain-containing protein [Selenomonadaceae bacterium]|nr:DUF805 domain-containing protein [Selenomonadaceae bacterium]